MKRKTALLLALASALVVALIAIIADDNVRERLGSTYYILALAIIGCVLLLLAGYFWDRTLIQRLKGLRTSAQVADDPASSTGTEMDDGDPDEIIGLARQIERMARALQRVEASYRGIVEDQVDLICRYRADGNLTFVNAAYAAHLGRKRAELLGQPAILITAGLLRVDSLPQETAAFENTLADTAGRAVVLAWTHRPIKDSTGALLEYQAVGHDITARKEAEALLRAAKDAAEAADRAKGEFLAIVSHELRTPINAIIGFADILRDTPLTSDQRVHADLIASSGRLLETLIADILDLSKIEAGTLDIATAPFALRGCIEQVCQLHKPRAVAAGLTLEARIAKDVPAIVNGDQQRLGQILHNLVGNAIKFTERGGVTLTLDCARSELLEAGNRRAVRLRFAVRDTGIGIPHEKMNSSSSRSLR
ncbi:MAG: histidine kinase dimerization/phospho-acceptor domain-containing protein [Verrucomicrobiota bacterium]